MANVSGLVQYFIRGSIEGFGKKIAPVTSFAYAVDEHAAGFGDVVRVPFVQNETGSSVFTFGTGFTAGSANGVTGMPVTLGTLLYQPIWLTDNDYLRLNEENLMALGRVAGARLASDFLSASVASVVSWTNFPQSSSFTSGQYTASAAPLALMKQCDDLDWPDDGRVMLIPTDTYTNLLSNTAISAAEQFGNASAIQRGEIPQIFGFTPFKCTFTMPNKGFAANSNAMAFAFGAFKPQDAGDSVVESYVAKDDKSGITLVYRKWYDPTLATTKQTLSVLGGVAKINSKALVLLV